MAAGRIIRVEPGARDHDLVDEALALFDLSALQDRKLDSLSGGQRQRAFVAMAYAQSTPWMGVSFAGEWKSTLSLPPAKSLTVM